MREIRPSEVLKRRADVRFRVIEDEGVVVRQAAAEVLVFNAVATRLLALADGSSTVSDWIDTLFAEFDVERSVLERDVVAFAGELLDQGLLEEISMVGSVPVPAGGRQ